MNSLLLTKNVSLDHGRWRCVVGAPLADAFKCPYFQLSIQSWVLSHQNKGLFALLEEAENERMHLMTALEMKQPGVIFRGTILLAQGIKDDVMYSLTRNVVTQFLRKLLSTTHCAGFFLFCNSIASIQGITTVIIIE